MGFRCNQYAQGFMSFYHYRNHNTATIPSLRACPTFPQLSAELYVSELGSESRAYRTDVATTGT